MSGVMVVLAAVAWVLVVVAAVGVGHLLAELGWRKRAQMRAFDSMVREYRDGGDARLSDRVMP